MLLNAISPIQSLYFDKKNSPFSSNNQKIDLKNLRFTTDLNNTYTHTFSNENSHAEFYI